MRFLAGFVPPIFLFITTVKIAVFKDGQTMFPTYFVRYFPQLLVVADFVLKFCTVLKLHGIHNEMAMHIVCIQVNSHKHLILVAPHPPCSFHTDFKGLLRCDLARLKTLYPMITDDLATKSEPPLYGNHFGIGILL